MKQNHKMWFVIFTVFTKYVYGDEQEAIPIAASSAEMTSCVVVIQFDVESVPLYGNNNIKGYHSNSINHLCRFTVAVRFDFSFCTIMK